MGFWNSLGSILNTLNEFADEVNSHADSVSKLSNSDLKKNYDKNSSSLSKKAALYKEAANRVNKRRK